jgi:hypothetical protein
MQRSPELKERNPGELSERAAESAHYLYAAGVLALMEPGPAAVGVVVADRHRRMLASRAHYIGRATRSEAATQALLAAMRLALISDLKSPVFRIDDPAVSQALEGRPTLPDRVALDELRGMAAQIPGHRVQLISPASNLARSVAVAPLADWLPERTRRAERLQVRPVGDHVYEVESESHPGQVYRVTLGRGAAERGPLTCECADFQYRGIPCKHLLAVAREAGLLEQLFYPETVAPPPATAGRT